VSLRQLELTFCRERVGMAGVLPRFGPPLPPFDESGPASPAGGRRARPCGADVSHKWSADFIDTFA
jgi:hypothetical protein